MRRLSQTTSEALRNANNLNHKAIRRAAQQGHIEVVRYLGDLPPARRGASPGAANNCALVSAAQYGCTDVMQYLCALPLELDVNPGADNSTALVEAAMDVC